MKILTTNSELREAVKAAKFELKTVGFVPTMGALHQGHLTLIRTAKENCDFVIVSIFVNPTQFAPGEDFERYPRNIETDAAKCQSAGADIVFHPEVSQIYPADYETVIQVPKLASRWEGEIRPGHFTGVASVCARLFNIVLPDIAYFGQKDYQQLRVIQRMVADLHMPLEIISIATVRDADGLALSSRNAYLTAEQRVAGLVIRAALTAAKVLFENGELNSSLLEGEMQRVCRLEPEVRVDYLAAVDAETLEPVEIMDRNIVLLAAIRVGNTRLIDNELLNHPEKG